MIEFLYIVLGMILGALLAGVSYWANRARQRRFSTPPPPLSRSQQRTREAAEAYARHHPILVPVHFVRQRKPQRRSHKRVVEDTEF